MKSVFVVTGSGGQYSDAEVWNIRALATKAEADAFAKNAAERWPEEHEKMERLEDDLRATREKAWRAAGWGGQYPVAEPIRDAADADFYVVASRRALEEFKLLMADPRNYYELPDYRVEEVPFGAAQ